MDPLGLAVLLGAVQGVTEFLPISSDGHLAIANLVVGAHEPDLAGTLVMHLGTVLATVLVLRNETASLLVEALRALREGDRAHPSLRTAAAVVAGSVPTAAIGLGLHDVVEETSKDLRAVAAFLLVTAACVLSTRFTGKGRDEVPSLRVAFLVGVVQGLAVLPGWSRSGSTIAAAMALGLSPAASFRFSFLLSLPAIVGASLLELRHPAARAGLGIDDAVAAVVAFAVGVFALLLLRRVVARGRFDWFAAYLFPLALALLLLPSTNP